MPHCTRTAPFSRWFPVLRDWSLRWVEDCYDLLPGLGKNGLSGLCLSALFLNKRLETPGQQSEELFLEFEWCEEPKTSRWTRNHKTLKSFSNLRDSLPHLKCSWSQEAGSQLEPLQPRAVCTDGGPPGSHRSLPNGNAQPSQVSIRPPSHPLSGQAILVRIHQNPSDSITVV